MKPERWQKIDLLLGAALEREPAERAVFLAEACAGDETLQQEVESLLRSEQAAGSFMETPVAALAADALAAEQARARVGERLGHYQILSRLGAGGMGEVYLARDGRLGRNVALKLLPVQFYSDPDRVRRFEREGRAASALNHPNIITIHDFGEVGGVYYIATELIRGETLRQQLASGPMNLRDAIGVGQQTASALSVAHAAGIIHRDIKPENIMLRADGYVKVLDFGLAKLTGRRTAAVDSEDITMAKESTEIGAVMGTVQYMSPEQVRGQKVDARSDIFSLGVVLYEMLAGESPFARATTADVIAAILDHEPPPLARYLSEAPRELEHILSKALRKNREERYQTAEDLLLDLKDFKQELEFAMRLERSGEPALGGAGEKRIDPPTAAIEPILKPASSEVESTKPSIRKNILSSVRLWAAVAVTLLMTGALGYVWFRQDDFASTPREPATGIRSDNPAAYNDYMRGKVLVSSENQEDIETAIKLLEQAVSADPGFAAAWAVLARAYVKKSFYYAPEADKRRLNVDAEVAVERALALDPDLGEGHFARGLTLWTHAKRFPHKQAIQSYKRALDLNPGLDDAHHELAVVYIHIGLFDKASAEIEMALQIKPSNDIARFRIGIVHIYETKYEEALAVFKYIPPDANPSLVNRSLASVLFQLGRTTEASAVVEQYLKAYPKDQGGNMTSIKAMLVAKAGNQSEAEALIQRAIEIGKSFGHFHHTAYNIASAYAILNRPAEAVKWLEETADEGFPCYPLFERDANLNSLRKDERFIALMSRFRKQWEHYKATL
ncbi:MAG: protein kinase [Acidobacteria bacterium]|nr:protein kinase [Acidobacteriota bacterium]MCW5969882.1 protein kinase [Blastocatellales bacterium]